MCIWGTVNHSVWLECGAYGKIRWELREGTGEVNRAMILKGLACRAQEFGIDLRVILTRGVTDEANNSSDLYLRKQPKEC